MAVPPPSNVPVLRNAPSEALNWLPLGARLRIPEACMVDLAPVGDWNWLPPDEVLLNAVGLPRSASLQVLPPENIMVEFMRESGTVVLAALFPAKRPLLKVPFGGLMVPCADFEGPANLPLSAKIFSFCSLS